MFNNYQTYKFTFQKCSAIIKIIFEKAMKLLINLLITAQTFPYMVYVGA